MHKSKGRFIADECWITDSKKYSVVELTLWFGRTPVCSMSGLVIIICKCFRKLLRTIMSPTLSGKYYHSIQSKHTQIILAWSLLFKKTRQTGGKACEEKYQPCQFSVSVIFDLYQYPHHSCKILTRRLLATYTGGLLGHCIFVNNHMH